MIKDFRTVSFETIFDANLNFEKVEIIKNKLAENQLMYRSLITAYNKRMSLLQHVISEGK